MPSKACLLALARAARAPGRRLTLASAAAALFVGCGGQTQAPAG
jgi:hypothetical protein